LNDQVPRQYRNPFLVAAMTELNLIEHMGNGIHRMAQNQVRRFLPLPDYDLDADVNEVRLSIPGAVLDEAYSRILMAHPNLPIEDVLALDRVQKRLDIADEAVVRLRKAKLIEGRRPHLRVGSVIAAALGAKGEYIQTRAQDDAHYSRLIVDYLEAYGTASRKEIDSLLERYLPKELDPKQQRSRVTNLLSKMRSEGVVINAGTQQAPKWKLV
jgi:ATP-dependent DNA helicase RecG